MTSTTVDTSINGTHTKCVQEVYGPDLFGPCKPSQPSWLTSQQNLRTIQTSEVVAVHHSTRYVPKRRNIFSDLRFVKDTTNGEVLRNEDGSIYFDSPEGAQQTADELNERNDWAKTNN